MLRPVPLLTAFLVVALAGCGGGGSHHSSVAKAITVQAASTTVKPNGTVSLTAVVEGGGRVTWSVDGGDANGTVSASGLYTAPATQGTYTVRATSGDVSGTISLVVTNGVAISLTSTATPPLAISKSKLTFAASVVGSSDKTVLWSVKDASGTAVANAIAADGTFTAPDAPGTYTVVGTSDADASKTVSAAVTVAANVNVRVTWKDKGDIVLSFRPDKAPNTVANFVTLVNKGFYDGIVLHRKTSTDTDGLAVIQWGDPLTKTLPLTDPSIGTGGPGYTIPFEDNDLSNLKYTLAMARSNDKDSGSSQVFINLADQTFLDHTDTNQGYVVFGAVASGQSVVDALDKGDVIVASKTEAVSQ